MRRADGNVWRSRIQTYDSTFGQEATDPITLHFDSLPSVHQSQPGVSLFNDTLQYRNPLTPTAGVKNPHTGTSLRIKSVSAAGAFMQLEIAPIK